jgi:hypothetical protein
MRAKIAQALKTEYASLGLSQKALDGVAAILEKTIKDESEIDAAIKEASVKDLLKLYQKEADSAREERTRIQREYDEYKEKHPETEPNKKTEKEDDKDNPLAKELAELKAKQEAVEAKLKASETKVRHSEILNEVHRIMKEKGADNDFIRNMTLKGIEIGDDDTAESLAEKYQAEYDKNFKEAYGDGYVPPKSAPKPNDYKEGAFADEVKRLKAAGKLPADD